MGTQQLDSLTIKHTSFSSMHDLLYVGGDYRPRFDLAFGDEERKAKVAELVKA